jgi:hypothetical protein
MVPGVAGEGAVLVVLDEDVRVRRGAGEELRDVQAVEVDEDAGQRAREELRAQQAVGVDEGVPGLADAPGRGELRGARRRRTPASTSSGSSADGSRAMASCLGLFLAVIARSAEARRGNT